MRALATTLRTITLKVLCAVRALLIGKTLENDYQIDPLPIFRT